MSDKVELELVEEYVYARERRFRFRIKGTNIILNVEAEDVESGLKKAVDMIRRLRIIERLKELKSQ